MNNINEEAIRESPSRKGNKHPITQDIIDDILSNELKNFKFPVKPLYNPRIWANGMTIGEIYPWGQLKEGTLSIQIGKQDSKSREFLVDTLLHEYFEAYIMINQFDNDFFRVLCKKSSAEQHDWIYGQIDKHLKGIK